MHSCRDSVPKIRFTKPLKKLRPLQHGPVSIYNSLVFALDSEIVKHQVSIAKMIKLFYPKNKILKLPSSRWIKSLAGKIYRSKIFLPDFEAIFSDFATRQQQLRCSKHLHDHLIRLVKVQNTLNIGMLRRDIIEVFHLNVNNEFLQSNATHVPISFKISKGISRCSLSIRFNFPNSDSGYDRPAFLNCVQLCAAHRQIWKPSLSLPDVLKEIVDEYLYFGQTNGWCSAFNVLNFAAW